MPEEVGRSRTIAARVHEVLGEVNSSAFSGSPAAEDFPPHRALSERRMKDDPGCVELGSNPPIPGPMDGSCIAVQFQTSGSWIIAGQSMCGLRRHAVRVGLEVEDLDAQ